MLDLCLAIAHHIVIYALFGILVAQLMLVKNGMPFATLARIVKLDLWYGVVALLILIIGLSRAIFAAKGWNYYSHNVFFWCKIITFGAVGIASIWPTIAFRQWTRSGILPDPAQVSAVRRVLHIESALFCFLLFFAAAMARGFGELPV